MSSPDPLCRYGGEIWHETPCSDCEFIAKVRADERERIAQAIDYCWTSDYDATAIHAYEEAARIARGEQ